MRRRIADAGHRLVREQLECEHLQRVAREDRGRLVEGAVRRRPAATQVVVVHRGQVVVHERIGVDQLDGRRRRVERVRCDADRAAGRIDEQRPDALALAERGVAHCLRAGARAPARPAAGSLRSTRFDALAEDRLPVAGRGRGLHRRSRQSCVRRRRSPVRRVRRRRPSRGRGSSARPGCRAFWHRRVSTTPRSNWRRDSSSGSSPLFEPLRRWPRARRGPPRSRVWPVSVGSRVRPPRRDGARSVLHAPKSGVRICLNRRSRRPAWTRRTS